MNTKYPSLIRQIVQSLTTEEKDKFLKDKKNKKYHELYKIFIENDDDFEQFDLAVEQFRKVNNYTKGTDGFSSQLDSLHKNLTKFVFEIYTKNEDEYIKLKRDLEIANALVNKELYLSAFEILKDCLPILKSIKPNGQNHYLFIQFIKLCWEIATKENISIKHDLDNNEILKYLFWASHVIANSNISNQDKLIGNDLQNNVLLEMMALYFTEKKKYKLLVKHLQNNDTYDWIPNFSNNEMTKKKYEGSLYSLNILLSLKKIYAAYNLKDSTLVYEEIQYFISKADKWQELNYQTFIFVLIHIWELQVQMGIENNYPIDLAIFNKQKENLMHFAQLQIKGAAQRIELNSALIYYLNGDFIEANNIFKGIGQIDDNELNYYILFFEITSYFDQINYSENVFEITLNKIKKLKPFGSAYADQLLNLLKKNNSKLKRINAIHILEESIKPLNKYDKVLQGWVNKKRQY
jgi:hypothetical protein